MEAKLNSSESKLLHALVALLKTIGLGWALWASNLLVKIDRKIAVLEFQVFGTLAKEKTKSDEPYLGSAGLPVPNFLEKKNDKRP